MNRSTYKYSYVRKPQIAYGYCVFCTFRDLDGYSLMAAIANKLDAQPALTRNGHYMTSPPAMSSSHGLLEAPVHHI